MDRKVDVGRRGSSEERNTWDRAGRIWIDAGAEVERPEGKSLVWSGSLAWQKGEGWSRDGHLIWIGSSQPNVSAGSQHAW